MDINKKVEKDFEKSFNYVNQEKQHLPISNNNSTLVNDYRRNYDGLVFLKKDVKKALEAKTNSNQSNSDKSKLKVIDGHIGKLSEFKMKFFEHVLGLMGVKSAMLCQTNIFGNKYYKHSLIIAPTPYTEHEKESLAPVAITYNPKDQLFHTTMMLDNDPYSCVFGKAKGIIEAISNCNVEMYDPGDNKYHIPYEVQEFVHAHTNA